MTKRQKLELRASEIRAKLSELAGVEALTDEQRGEIDTLRNEYSDTERRIQAASIADDQPEGREVRTEDKELIDLIAGADVGAIFTAALEHRATDGRTAELQEHLGLGSNQVPLALLRGAPPVEARAVTPAPSDVGTNQAPIIPAVFPQSCAAWLGVDMPTVGVGEASFPVLTTSATVHVPAENTDAAETTGAFSADVLTPSRLQAAFFYSREDRARFAGMDEALRANLSDALGDKLDQQVLNGAQGLFNGTKLANHNVSDEDDFQSYMSHFAFGRVDGTYASMLGELRILMGSATYGHAGSVYAGTATNKGDWSAAEKLASITSGVKVSAHVPAVASNKQNSIIRLGARRDMVVAIWEGVTLIPDEITLAKKGQIQVTAVMLHAVKILRSDGFHKQQAQLA